jgi:hypothetical protein
MANATKADWLTAMGGATTAVGSTKAFTAAAGNFITMSSHGLGDFTGPVQFAPQGAGVLPGGLEASTHNMRATMQTVADQREQCLDEVLCFPGYRDMPKDVNVNKFWAEAVQGVGF